MSSSRQSVKKAKPKAKAKPLKSKAKPKVKAQPKSSFFKPQKSTSSSSSSSSPSPNIITPPDIDFEAAQARLAHYYPHTCQASHPHSQLHQLLSAPVPSKNVVALHYQEALRRLSRESCSACPPLQHPTLWQEVQNTSAPSSANPI
jgi:hypothetical protein